MQSRAAARSCSAVLTDLKRVISFRPVPITNSVFDSGRELGITENKKRGSLGGPLIVWCRGRDSNSHILMDTST